MRGVRRQRGTAWRRFVALAVAVAVAALLWSWRNRGDDENGTAPGAPRLPREFPGIVRAEGAPVAGAHVLLYEDVADGYVAEGRAADDGTFRLSWTPTRATDTRSLYVAAWDPDGRTAIAEADPRGTTIDLLPQAELRGRVVDAAGHPVAGASVVAAVRHGLAEALLAWSDADGRFTAPLGAPVGAPVDVLVRAPGYAARVERLFRGGDFVTVHVAQARDIWLRAVDPRGRPVQGARVRLDVARALEGGEPSAITGADGRVVLEAASDGSHVSVDVEAEGFLPAEAPAWPGLPSEVILWPAREVEVLAWDAWNSKGIEGVRFDVDPLPVRGEEWWGPAPGSVGRPVPVRPGANAGTYVAMLPRCPVNLYLAAPGYGDGSGNIPAAAAEATIRLQPPLSRDKPAALRLRASPSTPAIELIVADESGAGFLRRAVLRDGQADVVVPPGIRLQVGSGMAVDGIFVPKHNAEALRPGERRTMKIEPRPAHRLRITTDPKVDGEATLVATELARYVAPQRTPVRGGHAEFWVAPGRKYKIEVDPPPGFFPHEADVETEREDEDLDLHLQPAPRLRYRVTDSGGSPIPFATVLAYEPGIAGKMALDQVPRTATADADGVATFDALRPGDAAVEIGADLFRSRRMIVKLPPEGLHEAAVALDPAGTLTGTVVDGEGASLAGVHVRVLPPRISWLPMPGGGTRELYDLTESSVGDALTDENGRFTVPDRSPGPPLVAFYPPVALALCPMAFEPSEQYSLARASYVELELPSSPEGVYLMVGASKALLVKTDPPLSLRPLPLLLPAGRSSLYAKLRDWRWAAREIDLRAGETIRLELDWRR